MLARRVNNASTGMKNRSPASSSRGAGLLCKEPNEEVTLAAVGKSAYGVKT